jgi:hypothetical protein
MKKTLSILFSALALNLYSSDCEQLKQEIIYHQKTSTTSENTNELLEGLTACDFDKYKIALISNPEFFMQAIDELKNASDGDISIGALTNYLSDFENTKTETHKEYYNQIKLFVDYNYSELTSENLEGIISDWSENNGQEIAAELKNYVVENKLVDNKHTVKFVLNDFYLNQYDVVPFDDNLNSISWKTNESGPKGKEIDKKYYEERIKISSKKIESKIILTIELATDWNIYSIEKESTNIFKTTISSQNRCLNTSELKVTNEKLVSDPMGVNGDVKVISGTSEIEIPIVGNCEKPIQIEFTFSLVNNDGSSLPFVKEIIEIK